MIAVADTSFILAYTNKAERQYATCVRVFRAQQKIYLPQTVLTETVYMLSHWLKEISEVK
jgi:predicted nucleic-acid-binding protein